MKILFRILVVLGSVFASIPSLGIECRGGDGTHPLLDISDQFSANPHKVPTLGNIKDYVYWSNSRAVVYRNERNQLFRTDLYSRKTTFLAQSPQKISRVLDPNEKFVLSEKENYYLDTHHTGKKWGKFESEHSLTHIFWNKFLGLNYLYSLANYFPQPDRQVIEIYRYRPWTIRPFSCDLPVKPGEIYYVGSGHSFPDIFLYKTYETLAGSILTLYKATVKSSMLGGGFCDFSEVKSYPDPIPGEIQMVYQLAYDNAFAVVTKLSSTTKLFWDSPKRERLVCDYGHSEPIIMNTHQPVVASWSAQDGVSLLYPEEGKVAHILRDVAKQDVSTENLWLTDNGREFLVATRNGKGPTRTLYYMKLNRE